MKPQDSFEKIKHWLEYLEQKGQCIQSPKGCAKTHILSHAQALKKEIDRLLKINMDLAQDNSDMQFQISCLNAELKSRPKVVRCKDCVDCSIDFNYDVRADIIYCDRWNIETEPELFCSWGGEKKQIGDE